MEFDVFRLKSVATEPDLRPGRERERPTKTPYAAPISNQRPPASMVKPLGAHELVLIASEDDASRPFRSPRPHPESCSWSRRGRPRPCRCAELPPPLSC